MESLESWGRWGPCLELPDSKFKLPINIRNMHANALEAAGPGLQYYCRAWVFGPHHRSQFIAPRATMTSKLARYRTSFWSMASWSTCRAFPVIRVASETVPNLCGGVPRTKRRKEEMPLCLIAECCEAVWSQLASPTLLMQVYNVRRYSLITISLMWPAFSTYQLLWFFVLVSRLLPNGPPQNPMSAWLWNFSRSKCYLLLDAYRSAMPFLLITGNRSFDLSCVPWASHYRKRTALRWFSQTVRSWSRRVQTLGKSTKGHTTLSFLGQTHRLEASFHRYQQPINSSMMLSRKKARSMGSWASHRAPRSQVHFSCIMPNSIPWISPLYTSNTQSSLVARRLAYQILRHFYRAGEHWWKSRRCILPGRRMMPFRLLWISSTFAGKRRQHSLFMNWVTLYREPQTLWRWW